MFGSDDQQSEKAAAFSHFCVSKPHSTRISLWLYSFTRLFRWHTHARFFLLRQQNNLSRRSCNCAVHTEYTLASFIRCCFFCLANHFHSDIHLEKTTVSKHFSLNFVANAWQVVCCRSFTFRCLCALINRIAAVECHTRVSPDVPYIILCSRQNGTRFIAICENIFNALLASHFLSSLTSSLSPSFAWVVAHF